MSDPRELYQQVILEHNKKPRNFGKLEACTHHAEGHNPLCGDQLELTLVIEDGLVQDIRFQGSGCAIDVASASLMTGAVKGRPVAEAEAMAEQFRGMVRGDLEPGAQTPPAGEAHPLQRRQEPSQPREMRCPPLGHPPRRTQG